MLFDLNNVVGEHHNLGSETNDYDNDGVVNWAEYAAGSDPTDSDSVGTNPVFDRDGGTWTYTYQKRNDDSGLEYIVETTTNLTSGGGERGRQRDRESKRLRVRGSHSPAVCGRARILFPAQNAEKVIRRQQPAFCFSNPWTPRAAF